MIDATKLHHDDRDPVKISPSAHIASMTPGKVEGPTRGGYRLPQYPKGVLPAGHRMAMDEQVIQAWDFGETYHGLWAEGIGFMGYTFLAEMSQRAEYRRAVETVAEEMTRKWIEVEATGEEDKQDRIDVINDKMEKFKIRDMFRQCLEHDGYFGRGQLYIDYGADDWEELRSRLILDPAKLGRGRLKGFRPIDPTWTAPNTYESLDPTKPTFYRPDSWFIMGREIHDSRLLTIISRPVPDILKPAYNFGGLSLIQMMKPYVDNWLRTRQSVADLINAFTIFNLQTNLEGLLHGAGGTDEQMRLEVLANTRNNRGLLVTDKNSELLTNISAPLGTLDHLQAQAQEHISSITGIPLVKLLGVTPSGLNASSDGEIRVFYDHIHALQEKVCKDAVRTVLQLIQLDEWGEIDPDIDFEFKALWELDEQTAAQVRMTEVQTDAVLSEIGAIDADEVRHRVATEENSPYSGLDLEKPAPGPPGGEMGGIPGGGGGGMGEGEPPPGMQTDQSDDFTLGSAVMEGLAGVAQSDVGSAVLQALKPRDALGQAILQALSNNEDNRVIGQLVRDAVAHDQLLDDYQREMSADAVPLSADAEWDESKVKRDDEGKFSSTGGTGLGSEADLHDAIEALMDEQSAPEAEKPLDEPVSTGLTAWASNQVGTISKTNTRAFSGQKVAIQKKLSKQETGALGEAVILQYLKEHGDHADAKRLNMRTSNFPVDLIADHEIIEAKAGLASNGPDAQKWRLTIGKPGAEETEWLKTASPHAKARHNATKQQRISERKEKVRQEYSRQLGREVRTRTVTTIINPDTRTADIYSFDGFHDIIRWRGQEAQAAYVGSYKY